MSFQTTQITISDHPNHDFGWSEMTCSAWVMAKTVLINNVKYTRIPTENHIITKQCLAITHADHVISDHPNHDFRPPKLGQLLEKLPN